MDQDLQALIEQKERELGELGSYRVAQLEAAARVKSEDLTEAHGRLAKLKDDFTFNLRLIEERDAELQALEACVAELREQGRERDVENSELRLALDEASKVAVGGRASSQEREAFWHAKLREARDDAEGVRRAFGEAQRLWRETEARLEVDHATQLREAADESERARTALAEALEDAGRSRSSELAAREAAAADFGRAAEAKVEAAQRRADRAAQLKHAAEEALEAAEVEKRDLAMALQREKFERDDAERRFAARERQLDDRLVSLRAATQRSDEASRDQLAEAARARDLAERDLADAKRDLDVADQRRLADLAEAQADRDRALARSLETQRRAFDDDRRALLADHAAAFEDLRIQRDRDRLDLDARLTKAQDQHQADLDAALIAAQDRHRKELDDRQARFDDLLQQRQHQFDHHLAAQVDDARASLMRRVVEPKLAALTAERDALKAEVETAKSALSRLRRDHEELERAQGGGGGGLRVNVPPPPPASSVPLEDERAPSLLKRRVDDAIDESFGPPRNTNTTTRAPLTPLFTDDEGDAIAWLSMMPEEASSRSAGDQHRRSEEDRLRSNEDVARQSRETAEASQSEVARQREIIAAMRADLDTIRRDAERRDRDREADVAAARKRDLELRARGDNERRGVAAKVDGVQRDLAAATKKLATMAAERQHLMEISNALRAELRTAKRAGDNVNHASLDGDGATAEPLRRLAQQNRELSQEIGRLRAQQVAASPPRPDLAALRNSLRDRDSPQPPAMTRPRPTTTAPAARAPALKATAARPRAAKPKIRNYNIVDD